MRRTSTHIMFFPADPVVITKDTKRDWILADMASPAQWCVAVDFIEDNNPMSASMHQKSFAAKPTVKQVRRWKRKALQLHLKELEAFKKDYPHYF